MKVKVIPMPVFNHATDVLDETKKKGILEDENLIFDFIEEEGAVCVYRVPQMKKKLSTFKTDSVVPESGCLYS